MKRVILRGIWIVGCAAILLSWCATAEVHRWAGRTLNDFEWSIHEKLAGLPSHGVFDTLNFEVKGREVKLTGHVVQERVKQRAERAVGQLPEVTRVINKIEVLPESKSDDALRMNLYRSIYEDALRNKYNASKEPPIHIIVKDGFVTLEGVVNSEHDRNSAHLGALAVTSHLHDNLRVAPQGS